MVRRENLWEVPLGCSLGEGNQLITQRNALQRSHDEILTNHRVVVGFPHLAGEVFIGFGSAVTGENFFCGIPLEFAASVEGDDDEVANDGGAVAFFDAGDGIFAGFDAIKKIAHVVAAVFETEGIFGERCLVDFVVAGAEVAAVDPEPAVGAGETNAVALAVLIDDAAEGAIGGGGFNDLRDVVWPGESGFEFLAGGEAAFNGANRFFCFDGDGAVMTDGPAGDVIVMRAPVGDGSTGVIPPPTEGVSSAFFHVGNLGRLAEPHIPIEAGRDGLILVEWAFAEAGREEDFDGL